MAALVCAAPARPDRLPFESALKLQVPTAPQPLPVIALKSGAFLPVGRVDRNLTEARKQGRPRGGVHAIALFDDPPGAAQQAQLLASGLTLVGALPARAFFVRVTDGVTAGTLESLGVRWVGAVYPEDKLSPRVLASGLGGWALRPGGTADLRVKVFADVPPREALAALLDCGARVLAQNQSTREFTVNLAVDRLERLVSYDCVRWVEEVLPPLALFNDGSRAMAQADLAQAAPDNLSGAGVAVGIWDGGLVATNHADFSGRLVLGQTTGTVADHATHVAGTMAGDGSRSVAAGGTERQWRGIAPGAQIISYDYDLPIPEHDPAINGHAVVLSQNSWGILLLPSMGTCNLYGDYCYFAPEYDQIVTGLYGRGINVIFAAGNYRTNSFTNACGVGPYFTVGPPATAKNVLSVGAIQSDTGAMALFSSWGPVADGRLKPELVAPGAQGNGDGGVTSTRTNNAYGVMQGTSMAAPVVSGALALLVEDYRARYHGQNPSPSVPRALLLHTAADLDDATSWFNPGPDYASGYGLVQIRDAVDQLRAQGFLVGRVGHDETNTFALPVPEGTTSVKVTLVWDDPAALENAAVTLVNDLDLVVFDPQGTRRYPWTLNPADPAAPAVRTAEDHLNVIEQVLADTDVAAGDWLVQVVGHNVPEAAPQKYTLVFTPTTIPAPPVLLLDQAECSDSLPDVANHDGVLDPGETVAVTVVLHNSDGPGATNVVGRLTTDTPGVTVIQAESAYPELPPGGLATNLTPFTFKVAKTIPCGALITWSHITTADGFGFTNAFTTVVGQIVATNWVTNRYESVDVPKPIPDPGTAMATNEIGEVGRILDLEVSLRADHEWYGDLEFTLEHPDGTRVGLVSASGNSGLNYGTGTCGGDEVRTVFNDAAASSITNGSPPFVGSFRPVQPLAALKGRSITGTWRLHAADRTAEDSGTLLCWGLRISYQQEGHVCGFFNRTPVAFDQQLALIHDTATNLVLGASDPDGDPLAFNLRQAPAHGALRDFDVTAGTVTYVPDAGYVGADSLTFEVSDGDSVSAPATVTLDVPPPAGDLSLAARASPEPVAVGHDLTCQIVVTNHGPNSLTGVVLSNLFPAEAEFVSATASQGTWANSSGVATWELGELAAGALAEAAVVIRPTQPGWFTNTLHVVAAESDPDEANNTAEGVSEVRLAADLAVGMMFSAGTVLLGQEVRFELGVTNLGPSSATGVMLEDVLSAAVSLVSVDTSQGSGTHENGVVRVDLGELGVGSNALVTVTVRAETVGWLTNTVSVRMAEIDLDLTNNVVEVAVEAVPAVDVGVTVTASTAAVLLASELRYEIALTNTGPSTATGVLLEDTLPAGLSFVGLATSQGSWTNENGVVRMELGELGVGSNAVVTLTLRADALGFVTNPVIVRVAETDVNLTNNVAQATVEVLPAADLGVGVTASSAEVLLGTELRYVVVVSNAGPSVATSVVVEDVPPAAVRFVDVATTQGTATNELGVVRVQLGALGVGSNAVVTLTVRADQPGEGTNTVSVTASEDDPSPFNNAAEAVTVVKLAADVGVWLTAEPGTVFQNGEIRYELVVTNVGPNPATGVVLEDVLSAGLSWVALETSQGTATNENGVVRVELGELAVGGHAVAAVIGRAEAAGWVTNRASIRSAELDLEPTNNVAEVVVEVVPAADVGVTLTAGPTEVLLASEVRYELRVTNHGPSVAAGVLLEDALPVGMSFVEVATTQGTATNDNGVVRVEFGELGVGSNAVVTLTLRAEALGLVTNTLNVVAAGYDPEPGNNSVAAVTAIKLVADVMVVMTASANPTWAGSELRFETRVANVGLNPATGVLLEDRLPAGISWVGLETSQGSATNENGIVRVELGELAAGSEALVTLAVRPDAVGWITNTASVRMAEIDVDLTNNVAEVAVEVLPAADVGVTLTTGTAEVPLGSEVRYELVVTNHGPSAATGVQVEDVLPGELSLVGLETSQGSCTNDNGVVRIEFGDLGVGSHAVVTLIVRADQLGVVTNTASVAAVESDPVAANNTGEAVTRVKLAADIGVWLTANPSVALQGGEIRYAVGITNVGPNAATGVVMEDTLPVASSFVEVVTTQGTATNDHGVVRVELGELGVGSNALVSLSVRADQVGLVTNRASVRSAEIDLEPTNNVAGVVVEVVSAPDVGVTLTVNASEVLLASGVRFEITVTNGGPSAATGVVVEDVLPTGVSFVDVVTTQGTATNDHGIVRVELGELGVGSNAVVTLTVQADQLGLVTNTVSAQVAEIDVNLTNNLAEATVEVLPAADVGVGVTAGAAEVLLGAELRYEIGVTNAGPSGATGVRLEDVLPIEFGLVSVATTQGTATNENGVVRVELGELGVGSHAVVTLTVRADQLGGVTNAVTVHAAEGDPSSANNTAEVVTWVKQAAEVGVRLTANAITVLQGGEVRYEMGVTNAGPNAATALVLEDVLPPGLSFVGLEPTQGSGTHENGVVRVDLGELGVGSHALVTVTVRAETVGWVTNRVSVQSAEIDLEPTNNAAEAAVEVMPAADVGLTFAASASDVLLAGEVRFEITVTNQGPSAANGVTLEDALPAEFGLVGLEISQGSATNDRGVVRVELGELGVGGNAVVTLTARADRLGVVTNTATVRATEADPGPTNNLAEVTVEIRPAADLGVTVAASPAEVILGNEVHYEIWVSNNGPSIATGVRMEDLLPIELSFVDVTTTQGTATNENGVVRAELGELGVGSNAGVTLTLRGEAPGWVTNTVGVSADVGDPNSGNNGAAAAVSVGLAADVGVTVAASARQVFLGRELRYEIAVTNAGPGVAAGVLLEDALPAGMEFLALETSQGNGTTESGLVRVALGELGAGSNAVVTLRVRAREAGWWTNLARLASSPLDPEAANDEATVASEVIPFAALRLAQSAAPEPVLVNDHLRYGLVVSNRGPYLVSDATLVDTLPESVELLSVTGSQGTYSTAGKVVTYHLGDLPADSGVSLTLTVTPRSVGSVTNVAVLSSAFADPADATLTSTTVTRVVGQPPLTYALSGTKLALHWPAIASDYILETTPHLSPPAWVEDRNPRVVVGDRITVTVKSFGTQAYYRLRKP